MDSSIWGVRLEEALELFRSFPFVDDHELAVNSDPPAAAASFTRRCTRSPDH